jgi:putative transposase
MDAPTHDRPGHAALRRGRHVAPGHVYHLTTVARGNLAPFDRFDVASAVSRLMHDPALWCDSEVLCWVLMPDHWHALVRIDAPVLAAHMRRFKAVSAVVANRLLGRSGPLWQRAYHDRAIRREEDLVGVARYIVANPVRAGLVRRVGDYPFWNAVWLGRGR